MPVYTYPVTRTLSHFRQRQCDMEGDTETYKVSSNTGERGPLCGGSALPLQAHESCFPRPAPSPQRYLQMKRGEPHAVHRAPRIPSRGWPCTDQELDGIAHHVTKHHLQEGPDNNSTLFFYFFIFFLGPPPAAHGGSIQSYSCQPASQLTAMPHP